MTASLKTARPGQRAISALYTRTCDLSPGFRKFSRHFLYQLMARLVQRRDWTFMNYGYAPQDGDAAPLDLHPDDETNRYCIQLYHHVAGAVDLADRKVLEIGSGRGGGAHFIKRYLNPAEMTGVDFSEHAVDLCRRIYDLPGLRFAHGDAEDLPFDAATFDAVVNVESSHCYRSMTQFLREVVRVLRPGGHFLFADFRPRNALAELNDALTATGLHIRHQRDITPNVLAAIRADNQRKLDQIRSGKAPRWITHLMEEFAGAPGSCIYQDFANADTTYVSYTLQKPIV